MEASVFFTVVHSVSDIDNLRSDDTSMLYHRSCYKTYTSRRNRGFFKVESAGSDHKPDTSQVPLLNEQTNDISTDINLAVCHTIKANQQKSIPCYPTIRETSRFVNLRGKLFCPRENNLSRVDKSGCFIIFLPMFYRLSPLWGEIGLFSGEQ